MLRNRERDGERERERLGAEMSGRQGNKLPSNLPQLQNLIKRDPTSYTEEVRGRRGQARAGGRCGQPGAGGGPVAVAVPVVPLSSRPGLCSVPPAVPPLPVAGGDLHLPAGEAQ